MDYVAYPMGKGSGSATAFGRADGFIIIPRQREYLQRDGVVDVRLLDANIRPTNLLHRRGVLNKVLEVGSAGGLEAAKRGECDLAGFTELTVSAATAGKPLAVLAGARPGLGELRRPDGRLAPQYLLSVEGERFVTDLAEPLRPGVHLLLLSADAGG